MNVQLGITRVCLFDLHFTAVPLRTPGLFQAKVEFLAKPAEYEKRQSQSWSVDMVRFRLRPLRHKWSHFWGGLENLCALEAGGIQFPRLHIPIEGSPKDLALVANLPAPFGAVPARIGLLVWPYGWSTRVELVLTQPSGLQSLLDACQYLREGTAFSGTTAAGAPLFLGWKLFEVFRQVTTWLQGDLHTSTVPEKRPISRQTVVAMGGFTAPSTPFRYNSGTDTATPGLATADRARLHGILLGRPVPLAEVGTRESQGEFLLTPLNAAGFGLTDFDNGSLIVLQEAAARNGKASRAARCLWRNTAAMLVTTNAILAAHQGARSKAKDWLDESADWGLEILRRLPTYYDNILCRRMIQAHRSLRDALKQA